MIELSILNYCAKLNEQNEMFPSVFDYAQEHKVPIIDADSLNVLKHQLRLMNRKRILEIGTAIGYSGLHMLSVADDIHLTTIEKDKTLHDIAVENFKTHGALSRVNAICMDAKEIDPDALGHFDMLFIDASKANNQFFFEKFEPLLDESGIIIVDNILARGLVIEDEITNKNLNKMVKKVDAFNQFVATSEFHASFLPVGDGLLIISR
ncbi:O-methyltransferase [Aliicoccus persicus]|uniref:O-methyltransferase n=1 Tax=Aliicoccus persicus TaxID=930138 RepID=A0A921B535_9STAP|nr:O-methyltransferase [Aliicoccus persicus]HJE18956.1 O-methyltransferase [Aliicoccus persicus]